MKILLVGMLWMGAAQAGDISIPPLSECAAEDTAQVEYRGQYRPSDPVRCWLFDRAAEEGCDKGLKAANHALEVCHAQGKGPCKITRCWENPQ